MLNRFEAVGIFASVAFMAIALFILNMKDVTEQMQTGDAPTATVVLSDENPRRDIADSLEPDGDLAKLIIDDVVVGSGEAVKVGDKVSVHYIGTLQNGQPFDNSYLKGEPFTFTVGKGEVIDGWDAGILGMKQGGQRILAVPADMAYGDRQIGPIPANSNLVFAIELLAVNE